MERLKLLMTNEIDRLTCGCRASIRLQHDKLTTCAWARLLTVLPLIDDSSLRMWCLLVVHR